MSQEANQDTTINTTQDWGSKLMNFDVIATATNNFSELNELGKGGFGIVYKVKLIINHSGDIYIYIKTYKIRGDRDV